MSSSLWTIVSACSTSVVFAIALATFQTPSLAAPTSADKATAQELYDEGMRHLKSADFANACPKFEESQRIDPQVMTQYQLAKCWEKAGKTASAWAAWLELAEAVGSARSKEQERLQQYARKQVASLEASLSKLSLKIREDVPGMRVTRDGTEVGRAQWGMMVPVDPGPHTIEAQAPGRVSNHWSVEVGANGAMVTFEIPALSPERPAPATPATAAPLAPPRPTSLTTPPHGTGVGDPSTAPSNPRRTWGWITTTTGLVSVGAGVTLVALAINRYHQADGRCPGGVCPDPADVQLTHQTRDWAVVGAVLGGIGAVALSGGLYLLLSSPSPSPSTQTPTSSSSSMPTMVLRSKGLGAEWVWSF